MFLLSFKYRSINHIQKQIGEYKYIEHVFSFRGKTNKRYIVTVEQYEYSVYIVKFCLQERKNYNDRYNHLTGLGECNRVLTTVGVIIRDLYILNPYASFGFVGAHLQNEEKENTKRFRLYKRVISQVISPVVFEHRYILKHSAYILVNRDNPESNLLNKITKMFEEIFFM